MSLTLVVEDSIQLQDFYHLNLTTWVGTEVHRAKNARFAQQLLQENDFDLIITRHHIATEKSFDAIYDYLKSENKNIPLIVLGSSKIDDASIQTIDSGVDVKTIIQMSAQNLGVTAKSMSEKSVDEMYPIAIQHFNHLTIAACDIYQDGETKLFDQDSVLDPLKIKGLVTQGIPELFVHKNDRLRFVTNFNQVIASKLDLIELNKDERIQAVEMSQDLLRERLEKAGLTQENIELANRNLKEMIQTTKQSSSLMRFLNRLLKNKCGFHFKHSQVLMFVADHLMTHLDWGTEEQREKLQFIAYFHDIALENDEQARIHSEKELRESSIPAKKKDLVKKHAMLAATLVSQYPNAPMGVEQIIKQHHGALNGIGFSEHFSQNVSPMAIVHILAEDFVTDLIDAGTDFDIPAKIAQMREKYTTQRFKKILDVLETITA